MAEGGMPDNPKNTMPQRGKVQKDHSTARPDNVRQFMEFSIFNQVLRKHLVIVKKEFMVHEDAGFAYQLQSEEIDKHFGLNRFNRRTVREDIPIAKVVQTDEEARQQEERFEQLQALKAQAEEDERVAKGLMQQELIQNQAQKIAIELTDEEYAKHVQEEEKKKYEKHLERKKQRKLKKEREEIEKTQQQRSEEARLAIPSGGSSEDLDNSFSDLQVTNTTQGGPGGQALRVTPGGRIEDDGDFSDFYNLPNNLDPKHRQFLQEVQDEELAKLIQEQEHKRTKAEVDKDKLKEIEEQDRRLAQIIQEQEKLKLRKAKQKKKQQEEARRAQEATQKPPALPPRNNEHNHRKYRRNSFIMSMENGGEEEDPDQRQSQTSGDEYLIPMQVAAEQRLQQESERIRAQQGSERLRSAQSSEGPRSNLPGDIRAGGNVPSRQISSEVTQNRSKGKPDQTQKQNIRPEQLPVQNVPDVERWLAGQQTQSNSARGRLRSDRSDSEHYPDSSSPGSYHSEESFPQGNARIAHNTSEEASSHYAVSDPFNFNIATAIDPTFTQRRPDVHDETSRKQPAQPLSRSLPVDERTLNSMSSREDSFHDDGPGVVNPYAPVQGQRRVGVEKSKKSRKQNNSGPQSPGPKQKGSCKQQ